MSKRMVKYLSAASLLALWGGVAGNADASIYQAAPTPIALQAVASAEPAPATAASDLLMTATLRGHDLYSPDGLRAVLREALIPVSAERAQLVGEVMTSLRLMGLNQEAHAAAAEVLGEALQSAPADSFTAEQYAQLNEQLQAAGQTVGVQLAQLDVDVDLVPGGEEPCSSEFECRILQLPETQIFGRGNGAYGG